MKLLVSMLLVLACAAAATAQSTSALRADPTGKPAPTPADTKIGKDVKRWFDLDAAQLQTRYRYIDIAPTTLPNISQGQWQVAFKGHFQFDAKARYRVNWLVQTGSNFTTGW